jgi:hypothetical protein
MADTLAGARFFAEYVLALGNCQCLAMVLLGGCGVGGGAGEFAQSVQYLGDAVLAAVTLVQLQRVPQAGGGALIVPGCGLEQANLVEYPGFVVLVAGGPALPGRSGMT